MFAAEIGLSMRGRSAGPVPSRRQHPRSHTQMPGRVGDQGIRSLCRVSDLSLSGARLKTHAALQCRAVILLTLPGQPPRRAKVIWSDDYIAGCAFEEPLDAGTLETLVGIYGFVPAPNKVQA